MDFESFDSTDSQTVRSLLQALLQRTDDCGIVFFDSQGQIRYWNKAAEILFGVPSDSFAVDETVLAHSSLTDAQKTELSKSVVYQDMCDIVLGQSETRFTVERVFRLISIADREWMFVCFKNVDIRDRPDSELVKLAQTDELSGLLNRRGFQSKLEANIANRLALAIIDVDRFKNINDEFGHSAGDRAIQWIGKKLTGAFKGSICIGRLGGDEFGVVLKFESNGDVKSIEQRFIEFCKSIESDWASSNTPAITISAGVAIASAANVPARKLLSAADKAMYESKNAGRNKSTSVEVS